MELIECIQNVQRILDARMPGQWSPIDTEDGLQSISYTNNGAVFIATPTALKCVIGLAIVPMSAEILVVVDEINATVNTGNAILAGNPVDGRWNFLWNSKFALGWMAQQGLWQFVIDWSDNADRFADHFGNRILAASPQGGSLWRQAHPDPWDNCVMLGALS